MPPHRRCLGGGVKSAPHKPACALTPRQGWRPVGPETLYLTISGLGESSVVRLSLPNSTELGLSMNSRGTAALAPRAARQLSAWPTSCMPATGCGESFSRIPITRSVDVEATVGAAPHMYARGRGAGRGDQHLGMNRCAATCCSRPAVVLSPASGARRRGRLCLNAVAGVALPAGNGGRFPTVRDRNRPRNLARASALGLASRRSAGSTRSISVMTVG
jgi:hypothetical protein